MGRTRSNLVLMVVYSFGREPMIIKWVLSSCGLDRSPPDNTVRRTFPANLCGFSVVVRSYRAVARIKVSLADVKCARHASSTMERLRLRRASI